MTVEMREGSGSRGTAPHVVRPQARPISNHSIVGKYEACGDPIQLRYRSEMPPASSPSSTSGASGRPSSTEPPSTSIIPYRGALRRWIASGPLASHSIHSTFWVPDKSAGEVGLLELMHRRGPGNRHHVLLETRPLEELQRNFSTGSSSQLNIDLSHNAFRLPKTALAVARMSEALRSAPSGDAHHATIEVRPQDIEAAVVQNLQSIEMDEYYLVRYRDYSDWAVQHYPPQRSSYLSKLAGGEKPFVEQCFAVHVSRNPGELIPLTEAQLLFGLEILQRQVAMEAATGTAGCAGPRSSVVSHLQHQHDLHFRSLNADQFNSLWGIFGDGFRQVGLEWDEARLREEKVEAERAKYFREFAEQGGGLPYTGPAWYDWRPSAIEKRIRNRLRRVYYSVGQLTVEIGLLGLAGYLVYRSLPGSSLRLLRGGGERGGGSSYSGRGRYGQEGFVPRRGFFSSVLLGPKDLMDYLLTPADYVG